LPRATRGRRGGEKIYLVLTAGEREMRLLRRGGGEKNLNNPANRGGGNSLFEGEGMGGSAAVEEREGGSHINTF